MPVMPQKIDQKVAAIKQWATKWSAVASSIGLTTPQATAYAAQSHALDLAFDAQHDAQVAAKNSTIALHSQLDRAVTMTGEFINVIKAYAELQPDPSAVYINALVPPPKTPSPVPAPGSPQSLKASVDTTDGSVVLSWKPNNAPNSGKVVYQVLRKLPGQIEYTLQETRGEKNFDDTSIPAGTSVVMYQIIPVCGTLVGERSEVLVVQFGSASSMPPTITAQFTQPAGETQLKKAA